MRPDPRTLPRLVEECAARFAGRVLVREKRDGVWRDTTYAEMHGRARRFAAGLLDIGFSAGDRAALLSEGRTDWITAELGILGAGGVNVPLSVKLDDPAELRFRLEHAGCRVVVVSGGLLDRVAGFLGALPALETIVTLDPLPVARPGIVDLATFLGRGAARLTRDPDGCARAWRNVREEDPANICYTSGTTADPKGIVLSHRNYVINAEQSGAIVPVRPDSVTLLILPWDHAFAHTCGVYTFLRVGASLAAVAPGATPQEALRRIPESIREIRPTLLLSVPALAANFRKNIEKGIRQKGWLVERLFHGALRLAYAYNRDGWNRGRGWRRLLRPLLALADRVLFRPVRAGFGGRLEYFIGGGALLDVELQRFFYALGMPMFQGYGLTEAAPVISANAPAAHKLGSSGRVVHGLELRICDAAGRALGPGEKGEIVVRGANVMTGYWRNEAATAAAIRDGWLHTGDLGYLDTDGFLYVLGREKSLLIGNDGEKYSPEGIEETILADSPFIAQIMLFNEQSPCTVALVVPDREALRARLDRDGVAPADRPAAALALLRAEVRGHRAAGRFPEKWLPAEIAVLAEGFTERNHLLNSTLKMVRGRIAERYRARLEDLLTGPGRERAERDNRKALAELLA